MAVPPVMIFALRLVVLVEFLRRTCVPQIFLSVPLCGRGLFPPIVLLQTARLLPTLPSCVLVRTRCELVGSMLSSYKDNIVEHRHWCVLHTLVVRSSSLDYQIYASFLCVLVETVVSDFAVRNDTLLLGTPKLCHDLDSFLWLRDSAQGISPVLNPLYIKELL